MSGMAASSLSACLARGMLVGAGTEGQLPCRRVFRGGNLAPSGLTNSGDESPLLATVISSSHTASASSCARVFRTCTQVRRESAAADLCMASG